MARPLLAYVGPAEAADVVREVAAARFDIATVPAEPALVARTLRDAWALLDASMQVRLTGQMIDDAPNLRIVVTATTGADHIDSGALARKGIPLLTLKGQPVLRELTAAAEHSWLLLMACTRRLPAAVADVMEGRWDRTRFPGPMLRGKTLGIIGCGRIGQWMARYGLAFGMTCQAYDPELAEWPDGIRCADLPELLSTSDFITLHVHLTERTRRMLRREHFRAMRPGAVFINTSRGDLIEEAALLEALQSGQLAAAGLDVLSGEPAVEHHPLLLYARDHPNLIITPHIGGFSPDAVRLAVRYSAERIVRHLAEAPA